MYVGIVINYKNYIIMKERVSITVMQPTVVNESQPENVANERESMFPDDFEKETPVDDVKKS